MYYGQSEKQLSEIFDALEELGPSILFIDELDSLATSRTDQLHEVFFLISFFFLFFFLFSLLFFLLLFNLFSLFFFLLLSFSHLFLSHLSLLSLISLFLFQASRRLLSVLLRKIEGFEQRTSAIVIGATNRKEDLDQVFSFLSSLSSSSSLSSLFLFSLFSLLFLFFSSPLSQIYFLFLFPLSRL